MVHIGGEIQKRAEFLGMGPTELGRRISKTKSNVRDIFSRKSIDTDLLVEISKALDFDFFSFYQRIRNLEFKALEDEMALLKKQNRLLTDILHEKMIPISTETIIKKIVNRENRTATVILKTGGSKTGNFFFNEKTGNNLNNLKGVIVGPIPSEAKSEEERNEIQLFYDRHSRNALEDHGKGFIPLSEIEDIVD